jgi:hypothetical protein
MVPALFLALMHRSALAVGDGFPTYSGDSSQESVPSLEIEQRDQAFPVLYERRLASTLTPQGVTSIGVEASAPLGGPVEVLGALRLSEYGGRLSSIDTTFDTTQSATPRNRGQPPAR